MRTIEATALVGADGKLVVPVPPDIPPGEHRVVVVIEAPPAPPPKREPMKFSTYDVGIVDPNFTYRREDLYGDGDDGR
jgi:hypothetical protein